jgi:hypothetical protein
MTETIDKLKTPKEAVTFYKIKAHVEYTGGKGEGQLSLVCDGSDLKEFAVMVRDLHKGDKVDLVISIPWIKEEEEYLGALYEQYVRNKEVKR